MNPTTGAEAGEIPQEPKAPVENQHPFNADYPLPAWLLLHGTSKKKLKAVEKKKMRWKAGNRGGEGGIFPAFPTSNESKRNISRLRSVLILGLSTVLSPPAAPSSLKREEKVQQEHFFGAKADSKMYIIPL